MMDKLLLAVAVAIGLVGLLVSALMLWLAALIFGVRRPAGVVEAPQARERIRFGRIVGLVFFLSLFGTVLLFVGFALYGEAGAAAFSVLSLLLSLLILRLGLPASWAHTLGIYITWQTFTLPLAVPLVFFLKFCVFEAFVVPTGAMVETLLGYHKDVVCPSCGLSFPVNASSEIDPSFSDSTWVNGCTCPNCRQAIQFSPPASLAGVRDWRPINGAVIPDPSGTSGDRVVVGTGLLGAKWVRPERFDVFVFDWPGERGQPQTGPPVRYIKRLVGLPDEALVLHAGKLYALPIPATGDENDAKAQAVRTFEEGKGTILRKRPEHILALMRLVHDAGHVARDLPGPEYRRWVGTEEMWQDQGAGQFLARGDGEGWLRYRHVLRDRGDKPQLITDFIGYNTYQSTRGHSTPEENWASDLILECEATPDKAEGEIILEVSKGADRFQARFDLATGLGSLLRLRAGKEPEQLAQADIGVRGTGPRRLRFANVDDQLTVWVDGRPRPGLEGVPYQGVRKVVPSKENDLERPASVGVKGARVLIRKLHLFRDTYYTTGENGSPSRADVLAFRADDPETWPRLMEARPAIFFVRPGHYFSLGDNSPESSDSRFWGLVPEGNLIGRALRRYYPFERAGHVW